MTSNKSRGVLAVHRCGELAAVHVLERHDGDFEVTLQCIARGARKRCAAHRMHRSAHHEIDLDLDLDATLVHEQLRLGGISRRDSPGLKAARFQPRGGLSNGLIDTSECGLARERMVGENQVEVDRKAWHVARTD
ncbi:MAG TPA: hypothetical protein VGL55_08025 [Steroidobacteraceae bacterium]|jgi:hypothetical protein